MELAEGESMSTYHYAERPGPGAVIGGSYAEELGHVLRLSRLRQGLSLRTAAKRVGLSAHSAIAEYESGRRILPEDILCTYEQVLSLPAGYLQQLRQQALRERAECKAMRSAEIRHPLDEAGPALTSDHHLAMVATFAAVTVGAALIAVQLQLAARTGRRIIKATFRFIGTYLRDG
jgi:transcriptional regulator with XRE-family HTH domain